MHSEFERITMPFSLLSLKSLISFSLFISYKTPTFAFTFFHSSLNYHNKTSTSSNQTPSIEDNFLVGVFKEMEGRVTYENDLNLKATELRLGLPGADENDHEQAVSTTRNNKRPLPDTNNDSGTKTKSDEAAPVAKAQIVGWPPIRSYRKNTLQPKKTEIEAPGIYVKVSMDGAPYLRKIDLKLYKGYPELLKALENMFKFTIGEYSEREGYKGSEYAPTYEDKDGDWMLVGDVPWDMFMSSCKRLRIMKGSEARGLGCGV